MSFRLDKYIWCVRLAKTRSQATEMINKGKVRLNEQPIKPSREVKLGDEIQIIRHTSTFSFKVKQLLERRVGAKLVQDYIIDITSDEERLKFQQYIDNQRAYQLLGDGKPNKKQRRDLDDFLENW